MTKRQKQQWENQLDHLLKRQEENWRAGRKEDWRLEQRIRMYQTKLELC